MQITKATRFEIIKPTNCTWEEFGKVLNDLRYKCARIANFTIQKCWEWENYRQQKKEATGEFPANKEKPNIYMMLREKFPDVGTGVINQVRQYAEKRFSKDRKDIFLLKKSIPSFRDNMPIMLANQAYTIREADGYEIDAMLLPSDFPCYRFSFLVKYGDRSKKAILDRLISGEYKQGAMQLVRDKHKKWYAVISFTFEAQTKEYKDTRTMEVYLGNEPEKELIVRIAGTQFERIIPINDIKHTLSKFEARLAEIKGQRKYRPAKGHGRKKFIAPAQGVQEKIRNFKLTANHKLSKIIVDMAVKHKCSEITVFGEFLEQWPIFDLKDKIRYKAEEQGIKYI